jgi:CubicO group peptidase (beta-lactamase class C family)
VRFDETSLCRIYSMTKPVTGVAAMMLVEGGRIKLDHPVADVLPEFRSLRVAIDIQKSMESRPAVKTMTMRHLLTHVGPQLLDTVERGRGAPHGLPRARRHAG